MTRALATDTSELPAELLRLCARLPVPRPSWHPYVSQIAACRSDFEQALALAAEHPAVLERVAALIDDEHELTFEPNASTWLTLAWQRLAALPLPEGQHPYLDEVLPALDALRLLLVALSSVEEVP